MIFKLFDYNKKVSYNIYLGVQQLAIVLPIFYKKKSELLPYNSLTSYTKYHKQFTKECLKSPPLCG